jgi:hypothetical protein
MPADELGANNGGDRMSRGYHNYAPSYAATLQDVLQRDMQCVLVEVGILKGTGLAVWCDLFPSGTVIGLDIDTLNFTRNKATLTGLGAFQHNSPTVQTFDAYMPDTRELEEFLDGKRIDVVIDDGPHTIEAITATARALQPLLNDRFVYFVEDNSECVSEVQRILGAREARIGSGGLVILKQ